MAQPFVINNRYGSIDHALETVIFQDVKVKLEKIHENNFSVDRIEIILSFYAPPLVKILVTDIKDWSVFHHRQNLRMGFFIVHPISYLPCFYHFVIEEYHKSTDEY